MVAGVITGEDEWVGVYMQPQNDVTRKHERKLLEDATAMRSCVLLRLELHNECAACSEMLDLTKSTSCYGIQSDHFESGDYTKVLSMPCVNAPNHAKSY